MEWPFAPLCDHQYKKTKKYNCPLLNLIHSYDYVFDHKIGIRKDQKGSDRIRKDRIGSERIRQVLMQEEIHIIDHY